MALKVLYPNGQVEAVLTFIETSPGVYEPWDGSVTVSVTSSGSAIEDGVTDTIKASVIDFLTSSGAANPLSVILTNTSGELYNATGGGIGGLLRASTVDTTWFTVVAAGNGTAIWVVINGSATELYSDSDLSWSDGDILSAEIIGNIISVYKGDDFQFDLDTTGTEIASGSTGMMFFSANFGTLRLDNWSGGNMVSTPTGSTNPGYQSPFGLF